MLINFDDCKTNERMYGGTAGRKIGIVYQGYDYLLKYPGCLREKEMKNISLAYSNGPVCEYIGSRIYAILGIPVHEVVLGERKGKIVAACRDFLDPGDRLIEFDKIKVTYEPSFGDSDGYETNGAGNDLYEILMTIREHPFLQEIGGAEERFWQMFLVDALIGNTDRNNSNWGVIIRKDGRKELAPVYDNGNCLNCKWDIDHMVRLLDDEDLFMNETYRARRCIFELHHRTINPYQLIMGMEYEGCNRVIKRLVPVIREQMPQIRQLIENMGILHPVQQKYYIELLETRLEQVFDPVFERTE